MPEDDKCQRWRKIAIDQLGYSLNLTLTFDIAALAYCFSLLKDQEFVPAAAAKGWIILALITLSISGMCGISCVINRLNDFRGTARRACGHEKRPTQEELRGLGRWTWGLFYAQLVGFGIGVAAVGIAVVCTYGSKLL